MGIIDYVRVPEMDCPRCGSPIVTWQTYCGEPWMNTVEPLSVAHFSGWCRRFKTYCSAEIGVRRRQSPPPEDVTLLDYEWTWRNRETTGDEWTEFTPAFLEPLRAEHEAALARRARKALRDLVGPSIDDVREAWGLSPEQCYCAHTDYAWVQERWYVWIGAGEPLWIHRATEAEAIQAAYDAAPKEVSE